MTWLLSPLTWLLLAACFLLPALRLRARMRWPANVCMAVVAIAFAGMTPLVANAFVAWLEQPALADTNCESQPPSTVVVLAGGLDGKPRDAGDFSVLNIASRRRMERGVQYWRRGAGRSLVVTGTSNKVGIPSEAMLMAAYAVALNVPASAIRIETGARTTWENARKVAGMAPATPRRIALVTSAMHMLRAKFAFRSAGFRICPLPADSRLTPVELPGYLVPRSSALKKTEDGLHELVGLAYYYGRNRIGSDPDWRN